MRSSESQPGRSPASRRQPVESLESRRLLHGVATDFHVQFGPTKFTPADNYVIDAGGTFGARNDDGTLNYGWMKKGTAKPAARRHTDLAPDARYDTFASLKPAAVWELEVHNGTYTVHLVAGDGKAKRGSYGLDVEGMPALRGDATAEQRWVEGTVTVTVTDGRLTVSNGEGFRKNRLNFIDVTEAPASPTPTPDPTPTPGVTPTPPAPSPNLE